MRKALLLALFHIVPFFVLGQKLVNSRQTSYFTYIYRISNEEAKQFYEEKVLPSDESLFYQKVDSFPTDSTYRGKLEAGHYLYGYAQKSNLIYELESVGGPTLMILNNQVDLSLILYDSLGNLIEDAEVRLKRRKVPFDPESHTYRYPKTNRQGLLSIKHRGTTYYHGIKRSYNNSRFRRIKNTILYRPPTGYLFLPFRWLYRGGQDIYRSIKWRNPYGFIAKIRDWFDPYYREDNFPRKFRGYLAFNQPKYRPGDTLRFKMLLLNRRGKPIKKPVEAYFKYKKLLSLAPSSSGSYAGEIHLHDSLNLDLDSRYYLDLTVKGKPDKVYMSESFRFEDYELLENTYQIRASKKDSYAPGEPIVLYAEGKDASDRHLLDARVRLTLTPQSASDFQKDYVFVPDTLWTWEQRLDPIGETKIIIPDSILPPAQLGIQVQAEFLNSNHEWQAKRLVVGYNPEDELLDFRLEKDSIKAVYLVQNQSLPKSGRLQYYRGQKLLSEKSIKLPFQEAINPFYDHYELWVDSIRAVASKASDEALLEVYTQRSADSVWIQVDNPGQIPFWYGIYHKNKKIKSGLSQALAWSEANRSRKKYFLSMQYVWDGQVQEEEYEIALEPHRLRLELNHPRQIRPGQQTEMEVLIKDEKGRAVPNVDLTAYGLTKKFKNYDPPDVPAFPKNPRGRNLYNFFQEDSKFDLKHERPLHWEYWNAEMHLDSIEYFRFLFPEKGWYASSYAVQDTMAQFSPFVVKDGEIVPLQAIYLDEVPIYYHKTTTLPRYVFPARPGYHHLKLRGAQQSIEIDSLYLEGGQKLIFSLNPELYQQAQIRTYSDDGLSVAEKKSLFPYLLPYQMNFGEQLSYLYNDRQFQWLNPDFMKNNRKRASGEIGLAGPFSGDSLHLVVADDYQLDFVHEPGFAYEFSDKIMKMRSWDFENYENYFAPRNRAQSNPDLTEEVLRPTQVDSLWQIYLEEKSQRYRKYDNPQATTAGQGRLELNASALLEDSLPSLQNILILKDDISDFIRIYPPLARVMHDLKPGFYKMLFLRKDGAYQEIDSVLIQANGLNYLKIQKQALHPPDSFSLKTQAIIQQKTYLIKGKQEEIFQIKRNYNQQQRFSFSHLPTRWVSGAVTDAETGQGLPGVSVSVKGTTVGIVTDMDGYYQLQVPRRGVLVFQAVGLLTQEVGTGSSIEINTGMQVDTTELSEVVVSASRASGLRALAGSVSAIRIRGLTSIKSSTNLATQQAADQSEASLLAPNSENSIRQNFRDYAFWEPSLRSDENGRVTFPITFPDDLTTWRSFFLAYDRQKRRTASVEQTITAKQDVVGSLAIPRFLVQGDTAQILGKVLHYQEDTLRVNTAFEVNGQIFREQDRDVLHSALDSLEITAQTEDSLEVKFYLRQADGFTDGELRKIPVYPRGIEESVGKFWALSGDTSLNLDFDPSLGEVKLYAEANILEVMLDEIEHVSRYRYLCNEQIASKIKMLLAEQKIRAFLGEKFTQQRDVQKLIRLLQKNRKNEGTWGWWQHTPTLNWISAHAAEALIEAKKAGYEVKFNSQPLIDYYTWQLEQEKLDPTEQLEILYLLKDLEAKLDYTEYMADIEEDTAWAKRGLNDQLALIRLKQGLELPYRLDTLWKYQRETMFGNLYWGEPASYHPHGNARHTTLLAYQILRQDGKHARLLPKIRDYFLEIRQSGHWYNTYESARVLEVLLPDLLVQEQISKPPTLSIKKDTEEQTVSNFPFEMSLDPSEEVQIEKSGAFPIYLTTYQSFWNAEPEAKSGDFIVKTYWDEHQENLEAGKPTTLVAEVEVKKRAEYVMIEIPIPAGCSYAKKSTYARFPETHREYFREKVAIFCTTLEPDTYRFEVKLNPRYSGKYHLNPAQASLMYYPTFFGRAASKQLQIVSK